jgi:hypothetical protein
MASPDIADALALTYARPVFPGAFDDWMSTGSNVVSEYDPFDKARLRDEPQQNKRKQVGYFYGFSKHRCQPDRGNHVSHF